MGAIYAGASVAALAGTRLLGTHSMQHSAREMRQLAGSARRVGCAATPNRPLRGRPGPLATRDAPHPPRRADRANYPPELCC
jgi:hypothetical protein